MHITLQLLSTALNGSAPAKTNQASVQQPTEPAGFKDAIVAATKASDEASTHAGSKNASRSVTGQADEKKSDHDVASAAPLQFTPDPAIAAVIPQVILPVNIPQQTDAPLSSKLSDGGNKGAAVGTDTVVSHDLYVDHASADWNGVTLNGTAESKSGASSPAVSAKTGEQDNAVASEPVAGKSSIAKAVSKESTIQDPGQADKQIPAITKAGDHETAPVKAAGVVDMPSAAASTADATAVNATMQSTSAPLVASPLPTLSSGTEKAASIPLNKVSNAGQSKDAALKPKSAAITHPLLINGPADKHKVDATGKPILSQTEDFHTAVKSSVTPAAATSTNQVAGLMPLAGPSVTGQEAVQTGGTATTTNVPLSQSTGSEGGGAKTVSSEANAVSASASSPALSSAQLVRSMHGSEMKIGMHSQEFGAISVNTSLTRQTLAAQISFDHPELGRVMAAHVPAIEAKLGNAYGLQTRVEVRDNGSTSTGDTGRQGGGEAKGQSRASPGDAAIGAGTAKSVLPIASVPLNQSLRLDIRI